MILGAGPFQVPAIEKAVAAGHYVITVDYLPENPGHRLSHQYVDCSTADREGVLIAASELRIDGIATFSSDVATPTVAYVCEQLGLPGASADVAGTLSNKRRFRCFMRRQGFPCPAFVAGGEFEDVCWGFKDLQFPVMFKPVDASGSRGVKKIERPDAQECRLAFDTAREYSRCGQVCVEEHLVGVEVGGDGFLADGRLDLCVISHKHMEGVLVRGHSLPTNISKEDQVRVKHTLEITCSVLGYLNGPLNFDVMVSSRQITIIEMSPRNGGNGLPGLIQRATGVDPECVTLQFALDGQPVFRLDQPVVRSCGSLVFGHTEGGTLRSIASLDTLREDVPETFELLTSVSEGALVGPFQHGGNMIGCVMFDCVLPGGYRDTAQRVEKALRLVVD